MSGAAQCSACGEGCSVRGGLGNSAQLYAMHARQRVHLLAMPALLHWLAMPELLHLLAPQIEKPATNGGKDQ